MPHQMFFQHPGLTSMSDGRIAISDRRSLRHSALRMRSTTKEAVTCLLVKARNKDHTGASPSSVRCCLAETSGFSARRPRSEIRTQNE